MAPQAPAPKGNVLGQKMGPLPVWGWAVVALGGVLLYRKLTGSSTASTSATAAPGSGTTGAYSWPGGGYYSGGGGGAGGGIGGSSDSGTSSSGGTTTTTTGTGTTAPPAGGTDSTGPALAAPVAAASPGNGGGSAVSPGNTGAPAYQGVTAAAIAPSPVVTGGIAAGTPYGTSYQTSYLEAPGQPAGADTATLLGTNSSGGGNFAETPPGWTWNPALGYAVPTK